MDHLVGQVVRGVGGHSGGVLLGPRGDGNDSSGEVHGVPGDVGEDRREESAKDSTRGRWQQHSWAEDSVHPGGGELTQVSLQSMVKLKSAETFTLTNKFLSCIASVREVVEVYTSSTEGTLGQDQGYNKS